MITNGGKRVISKYLLGQVPTYATHIAIGCGATPLDSDDTFPSGLENKEVLDFEMIRVPITSKGFVDDVDGTKIAFTAELPTPNRYEITEVGLWSSANNNLARGSQSKIIFDFQEGWQQHAQSVNAIPVKSSIGAGVNIEDNGDLIFIGSAGDRVLETVDRKLRKEGPRFLNSAIFIRGDSSVITGADGSWVAQEDGSFTSTHIHLNNITFDIGQNSPSDELVLSFSVVDKDSVGSGNPSFVKILIEFFRRETLESLGFAKAEIYVDGSTLTNNRYHVARFPISDLITSPDFTASEIRLARIYSYIAVPDGSGGFQGSDSHYIALDGFRIDNVTTDNPLYKLVGYSPTRTVDGTPILKLNNTNNYVEFRFGIGVT